MRFGSILVPWLSVALAVPAMSGDGRGVKKPRLDLRASPRMALMPVDVLVVAELVGGDAIEDFYCPAIEWDWGDGARSAHESDCPPFQPGMEMARRQRGAIGWSVCGGVRIASHDRGRCCRSSRSPLWTDGAKTPPTGATTGRSRGGG